uniref:Uncharacterized protein n=1 Tax=Aegilops tauschii subsp. strangulata TaxID=200361 RepID=A0A453DTI3_AEGTS
ADASCRAACRRTSQERSALDVGLHSHSSSRLCDEHTAPRRNAWERRLASRHACGMAYSEKRREREIGRRWRCHVGLK